MEKVRRKVHQPKTGTSDDLAFVLDQPAEVGPVGEAGTDPGKEGLLHGVHVGVIGLAGIYEHAAALLCDELRVLDLGGANVGHGAPSIGSSRKSAAFIFAAAMAIAKV
jgi:hypothetical protein